VTNVSQCSHYAGYSPQALVVTRNASRTSLQIGGQLFEASVSNPKHRGQAPQPDIKYWRPGRRNQACRGYHPVHRHTACTELKNLAACSYGRGTGGTAHSRKTGSGFSGTQIPSIISLLNQPGICSRLPHATGHTTHLRSLLPKARCRRLHTARAFHFLASCKRYRGKKVLLARPSS